MKRFVSCSWVGTPGSRRRVAAALVLVLAAVACGGASAEQDDRGREGEATTLRLGYFPNVTHAPAIVGLERGIFAEHLGEDVTLETQTFNAGGQAVEALFSDAIDLTYIGPNPAINGYAQSGGEAVRLIAGSTSDGAFLVVQPEISSVEDLRGRTLSSPEPIGNTQDVALRAWLADQGFETTLEGGGEVSILPQANAQIFETFRAGGIDGAWVPEPWATRLTDEDGVVLVDERDLWPGGRYVTTHVLVDAGFLASNPGLVKRFLEGHVAAVDATNDDREAATTSVIDAIEAITGARLAEEVVDRSWDNLEFTVDPIAASLQESANDAVNVGLLDSVDLDGIYDLTLLNEVLAELGREAVEAQ